MAIKGEMVSMARKNLFREKIRLAIRVDLTIHTETMERMKGHGILKAIGATNARMYSILFDRGLRSAVARARDDPGKCCNLLILPHP